MRRQAEVLSRLSRNRHSRHDLLQGLAGIEPLDPSGIHGLIVDGVIIDLDPALGIGIGGFAQVGDQIPVIAETTFGYGVGGRTQRSAIEIGAHRSCGAADDRGVQGHVVSGFGA